MRELNKTFSKKYNFKRLLQTTPALSKLYNKQEDAINSIEPVKHVQIIDRESVAVTNLDAPVNMYHAAGLQIFGPGQEEWPLRIKYAEQIPDLYKEGYDCTWIVKLKDSNRQQRETSWLGRAEVEIICIIEPRIVTISYSDYSAGLFNQNYGRINIDALDRIDENILETFFLSDGNSEPVPLVHCGIIPDANYLFNTTFYNSEIAHLYAESLRTKITLAAGHRRI